jgi:hypothetical protein
MPLALIYRVSWTGGQRRLATAAQDGILPHIGKRKKRSQRRLATAAQDGILPHIGERAA